MMYRCVWDSIRRGSVCPHGNNSLGFCSEWGPFLPERRANFPDERTSESCYIEDRSIVSGTLIPCFKRWVERKHGELNYGLTHFLTWHGGFSIWIALNYTSSSTVPNASLHLRIRSRLCLIFRGSWKEKTERCSQCRHCTPQHYRDWIVVNAAIDTIQKKLKEIERTRKAHRTCDLYVVV